MKTRAPACHATPSGCCRRTASPVPSMSPKSNRLPPGSVSTAIHRRQLDAADDVGFGVRDVERTRRRRPGPTAARTPHRQSSRRRAPPGRCRRRAAPGRARGRASRPGGRRPWRRTAAAARPADPTARRATSRAPRRRRCPTVPADRCRPPSSPCEREIERANRVVAGVGDVERVARRAPGPAACRSTRVSNGPSRSRPPARAGDVDRPRRQRADVDRGDGWCRRRTAAPTPRRPAPCPETSAAPSSRRRARRRCVASGRRSSRLAARRTPRSPRRSPDRARAVALARGGRDDVAGGIDQHQRRPGAHGVGAPDAEVGVLRHRMRDAVALDDPAQVLDRFLVLELRRVDADDDELVAYFASSRFSSGSTCMQLTQP